jgi:hypothetical protein
MKMKRKAVLIVIGIAAALGIVFLAQTRPRRGTSHFINDHGFALPPSATAVQTRKVDLLFAAVGLGHGNVGVFQIRQEDLPVFTNSLHVLASYPPAYYLEYWPSPVDSGFESGWQTPLKPIRMIDCASSVADTLRVWMWRTRDDCILVRVSTWYM